jgi:hypothetical protein
VIYSGQGKSRIEATQALIILIRDPTSHVNWVFCNEYLMQRDKKAFEKYFTLSGTRDRIHFMVGLEKDQVCEGYRNEPTSAAE